MIKLYSPRDLAELALIESILEGENIPYFIHNDHFGSLEIGLQIDMLNMKTIMVEEAYEERARELLQDFLASTKEDTATIASYSIFDKIRMAFEALFFGWFIPGRHWKKTKNEKDGP
jgi:hypothetical protein